MRTRNHRLLRKRPPRNTGIRRFMERRRERRRERGLQIKRRLEELRLARRRLSGEDAGFFYLEQPNQPLGILAVALLSPTVRSGGSARAISPERLRRHIEQRLDALSYLRWSVRPVPGRLHHPVFVDAVDFDLDRHLAHVTLPAPGSLAELYRFLGALAQRRFDRRHPLWQITLVDGLSDNRQALVARFHHCLFDGAAGLRTFEILFSEEDPDERGPAEDWTPRKPPGRWRLIGNALGDQIRALQRVPSLISTTVSNYRALEKRRERSVVKVPRTPKDTPPSPFANAFTRPQVVAHASFPLADFREIQNARGVSRFVVVAGVVAGAVRGYLADRDSLPEQPLVTSVPVSIETPDEPERTYGNHILAFSTSLATDIVDPWERLKVISAVAAEARGDLEVIDPELMWEWIDRIPPLITRLITTRQYRRRRANRNVADQNLLISSFRGPDRAWRLESSACEEFFWFGPPNQGVGLNITVWSYADRVIFGIEAFADALVDPGDFVAWLERSLAELVVLARENREEEQGHGDLVS